MDEFTQNNDSYLLPKQLLSELENSIVIESQINGSPWVKATRLSELFYEKYGYSLEGEIKSKGYSNCLKTFIRRSSQRLSIYNTPNPQEFYVAFLNDIVPDIQQYQSTATSCQSQEAEVSEDVFNNFLSEKIGITNSESQPELLFEIKSVNDLEYVLIEIIKSLMATNPQKHVTIAVLSQRFYYYYRQPIRGIRRSLCPDMTLIELLQTIPGLHVEKVDDDWQITVNDR